MIALIMAGGIGTRFWPLSRESKPKQFLSIISDKSMLTLTLERLKTLIKIEDIYIVTAASQTKLVFEHLPELPVENVIEEPFGMNTAPCIGISMNFLRKKYSDNETVVVLPADHLVKDKEQFIESLIQAEKVAKKGNLVTFGIKPNYPATGYGYIEINEEISPNEYKVQQFKEKPDLETAKRFVETGKFFWNSGMFLWRIDVILNAYQKFVPKIYEIMGKIDTEWEKLGVKCDISSEYSEMPKIPVDIGIMEKADNRILIPVDYGWSDVGSWKALYDISPKDKNDNVLKNRNITLDSFGNLALTKKTIALLGVENLVIVEADDSILITTKERAEDVKIIVNMIKEQGLELI